ncbi:MAG: hypothetical protein IPJ65_38750 [Archangiaceae bacterium]|nr:hypothetical protein [Archangiaceae bacterium]
MRSAWCAPLALAVACVGGEKLRPDAGDGGEEDAGSEPFDAGPPTPLDTIFSIGITDNSGGIPQSAPLVALSFHGAMAGPSVVSAKRVATPPSLDGNASDWLGIPESVVPLLSRGGAVGMSLTEWDQECMALYGRTMPYDFGITNVSVRAAFDDNRIYFLLQWADPTENRNRDTWVADGGVFTRTRENEDRAFLGFDVLESTPAFQAIGCSGACHIHEKLGDVTDAGKAYRTRMHTNQQGEVLDYWNWRAGTTDPWGMADDGYIDELQRKYDGLSDWIVQNQVTTDAGVMPAFMSVAGVNASPPFLFRPDAGVGAMPFDISGVTDGSRIPGWVMVRASPGRDDVSAVGRWASGHWTVEFSRNLTSADPRDTQFPPR